MHKCETCGQKVKVGGRTTHYYIGVEREQALDEASCSVRGFKTEFLKKSAALKNPTSGEEHTKRVTVLVIDLIYKQITNLKTQGS